MDGARPIPFSPAIHPSRSSTTPQPPRTRTADTSSRPPSRFPVHASPPPSPREAAFSVRTALALLVVIAIAAGAFTPASAQNPPLAPREPDGRPFWTVAKPSVRIRNEVTDASESLPPSATPGLTAPSPEPVSLPALGLVVRQQTSPGSAQTAWDLTFRGDTPRAGHEITIEFRGLLAPGRSVFTPSQSGVIDLDLVPSFTPPAYATLGWESGQAYVLPLVSVLDPATDRGFTVALPADANIPHLQFAWTNASTLRLTLGHRALGGGRDTTIRLLGYSHAADYREALRVYSDAFPRHFRPVLPGAPYEGAFWYHHIHDHPDFAEMKRQNVRHVWTSFWFTHLGEYLPAAAAWEPYTYAKWWKLGQTMTDGRIRTFVREMHDQGIGVHAYFNVTEYGGAGGRTGDTATAARILREQFADALVKDDRGREIPTWEGAMAMNPGPAYSLWPFLEDQVRRHLTRLPEIDGFDIDRLDWASVLDHGHDDGLTMLGKRPAANLAVPIGEAIREISRLAHAAGKRVFVNQFYRLEPLADVDGYVHENDYLPALAYLAPFRFACAWHMRQPYRGDLLPFEAQLKRRLHHALFPQMIAHEFPISQQAPDPRAADLLEIYAPLFLPLTGKTQVLLPHAVEVTGANDANLFATPKGRYVVPVTSRVRFLARSHRARENPVVSLRLPEAPALDWAHVYAADAPPYRTTLTRSPGRIDIPLPHHGTASVLVTGPDPEPPLPVESADRLRQVRETLFPPPATPPAPASANPAAKPAWPQVESLSLRVEGRQLGQIPAFTEVHLDRTRIGRLSPKATRLTAPAPVDWPTLETPRLTLRAADEGTWFAPSRLQLIARTPDRKTFRVAEWTPDRPASSPAPRTIEVALPWCTPQEITLSTARFLSRDPRSGGTGTTDHGATAAWIPTAEPPASQGGFGLELIEGEYFAWPGDAAADPRILRRNSQPAPGTCWFAADQVSLQVVPGSDAPYRLSLYLLDQDRNGRAAAVTLTDGFAALDQQAVTAAETARGIYLSWSASGPVTVEVRKTAGFNAVISGVFIDPLR